MHRLCWGTNYGGCHPRWTEAHPWTETPVFVHRCPLMERKKPRHTKKNSPQKWLFTKLCQMFSSSTIMNNGHKKNNGIPLHWSISTNNHVFTICWRHISFSLSRLTSLSNRRTCLQLLTDSHLPGRDGLYNKSITLENMKDIFLCPSRSCKYAISALASTANGFNASLSEKRGKYDQFWCPSEIHRD